MGIALFYLYFKDKDISLENYLSLRQIQSQLKSGDIILFQSNKASIVRKMFMFGRWTHVAIVHRRAIDHSLFIFEGGIAIKYESFEKLICDYQLGEKPGITVLRRLNRSLSKDQETIFEHSIIEQMGHCVKEHGQSRVKMKDSGEWFCEFKPMRQIIQELSCKQLPLCTANHLMNLNVPYDETSFELICTDAIMKILIQIGIINSSKVPACLIPNFFSTRPYDSLNASTDNNFHYDAEIEIKC
jgi:hypothetical protein